MAEINEGLRSSLAALISTWAARRTERARRRDLERVAAASVDLPVHVEEVAMLRPGRPGLLDVVAAVGDRTAHAVLGLLPPDAADARRPLPGEDAPLGTLEDGDGPAVVVDALYDTALAPLVLDAIVPRDEPAVLEVVTDDDSGTVLVFDACCLTVFTWLAEGPDPSVELLVALDEAGFNHLAAPLGLWRRHGRDLGVVQERLAGSSGGMAVALTSLRDLYAAGGAPEDAGGDFATEANAIGTMTARMHLALERAFGHEPLDVTSWCSDVESAVRRWDPSLLDAVPIVETLSHVRRAGHDLVAIRTHGDLELGRIARTDHGWVVVDFSVTRAGLRSPLADVADMAASFHRVALVEATENHPAGRAALVALAQAWEDRNRKALLAGYLSTPGIEALVPSERRLVEDVVAVYELQRAATGGSVKQT